MLHKIPSLFPWKHNKTKIMAEPVLEEDVNLEEQLAPCTICGRTFLPGPLTKHTKACEKNVYKKRKVFNSLKQRVEGTDLAPFHQQTYLKKPEPPNKTPEVKHTQTAWKEKHQELVSTIRAAKGTTLDATGTPNRQRSMSIMSAGFERCQTCDRQFGPKAYDRHVEWCKERRNRLPQSPANVQQAKERLEARIKYRVPPMSKPKKTVKEKYQSPVKVAPEIVPTIKSTSNLDRRPSVRKPVEKKPDSPKIELKPKRPEPFKRDETYNPILTAERQLMELLECDDFKSFTPNKTTPQPKPKTHSVKEINAKNLKHKRASVIDPPTDFQDGNSPDIFDENFELIENFINDNLSDDTILDKLDAISLSSHKTHLTDSENFNAFCDELSIDPRLINEYDNLSIPEHLTIDDGSPAEINKFYNVDCNKLPALEPPKTDKSVNLNEMDDLIASVANVDKSNAKKQSRTRVVKSQQSCSFGNSASSHDKKKNLSSLKRSISVLDPVKPKNLKNKEDVQNYFQEQEMRSSPKNNAKVKEKETSVSAVPEDLFSIDDEMYEEYKKYEQMYLLEKEEKLKQEKKAQEEESQISKISGDSAYGSLSRNKPKVRTRVAKLSPLENRADSASSSGSETGAVQNSAAKLSKFCHECGSKYPLHTAKFCVECGVKRLVL